MAFAGCLGPIGSVERPILDRFAQMARRNVRGRIEIAVRATFRIRSCARAERPSRVTAVSSNFSPSAEIAQCLRINFGGIWAFAYVRFSEANLSSWRFLARTTRSLTAAESSAAASPRSSLYLTAGTSIRIRPETKRRTHRCQRQPLWAPWKASRGLRAARLIQLHRPRQSLFCFHGHGKNRRVSVSAAL